DLRHGPSGAAFPRALRHARAAGVESLHVRADAEPRHDRTADARSALEPGPAHRHPRAPAAVAASDPGAGVLVSLAPDVQAHEGAAARGARVAPHAPGPHAVLRHPRDPSRGPADRRQDVRPAAGRGRRSGHAPAPLPAPPGGGTQAAGGRGGAAAPRPPGRLGCVPLKRIRPGHGSSIHYAGTFPITAEDRPLTCDRDSRLRGTRAVYLADGSIFPWLPPKGLTFNIMANADRVGAIVAERLR